MKKFIGRKAEIAKIQSARDNNYSEFIAVYGRRRVGKTMLIRHVFDNQFTFHVTGIANVRKEGQIQNFLTTLYRQQEKDLPKELPKNWFMTFQHLITFLEKSKDEKKVVFLDELPWFDTPKSDFLPSLEHFWNSWASYRDDVLLVVCGSAASWMINKLINHRGGLHNRTTKRIWLKPFKLKEAEELLKTKNPALNRYQIIQMYMIMGGIPFYLNEVSRELSAMQNIEKICFARDGLLRTEFENLFKALFSKAERHEAIAEAIATKSKGLTRDEILKITGLPKGGSLTRLLDEMEVSGFIRKYRPFQNKKKSSLYQLNDFYTLFYFKFIKKADFIDEGNWIKITNTPTYRAWSGYAFEQICLYHVTEIKQAIGISGVISRTYSWKSQTSEKGAQIDLVIDRNDQVVNICEIKFSQDIYTISKSYADNLRNKRGTFSFETGTKKAVFLTMITTYGTRKNSHYHDLVQNEVTMDALFKE